MYIQALNTKYWLVNQSSLLQTVDLTGREKSIANKSTYGTIKQEK
jgi:hypothetical protein